MNDIKENNIIDNSLSDSDDNEYNINQVFNNDKESNEDDSMNITNSMIEEEERMQLENQVEEEKEEQEIRKKQEETFQNKEESKQRLNFLLKKVGIFSEWLALKLEQNQNQQLNAQKKTEANRKRKEKMESIEDSSLTNNNEFENRIKRRRHAQKRMKKTNQNEKSKKLVNEQVQKTEINKENENNENNNKAGDSVNIKDKLMINKKQSSLLTGGTLRKYQVEGVQWLISLYDNGLNGILADEMGLGKTIQVIALLAYLKEKEIHGPFLIVSPLSTLSNWVAEIRKFAPSLPVVLYHGVIEERANIRKRKMKTVDENFPIVITSYEIIIKDRKFLSKYNWKYIIVDEGHRLKNYNCKLFRELKAYKTDNRLLLTGTPLQNNLSELWSLLNFILPTIFDDLDLFQSWFDFSDLNSEGGESRILDQEEKESVITNLHHILKPFLLRRLKTEVEKELPKKREYLLTAPLTPKQITYYRAALNGHEALRNEILKKYTHTNGLENNNDINNKDYHYTRRSNSVVNYGDDNLTDNKYFKKLMNENGDNNDNNTVNNTNNNNNTNNDNSSNNTMNDINSVNSSNIVNDNIKSDESKKAVNKIKHLKLQNLLMQLRKICNHPYLMLYDKEDFPKKEDNLKEGELPDIVASSGKMIMLHRLLPALIKEDHKVLIFTQMTRMMDILEEWFENYLGITYSRIDGSVPFEQREIEIRKFNDPECKVFLLSTRAGGLGINLTAADTVIIYDSDWNPQMDLQAQDRCHRIGQTKPVIVYRLVSSGSAEKKILEKANAKKKLEKLVIQKGNFKGNKGALTSKNTITIKELADILYIDEEEIEGSKTKLTPESILSNEDLKLILDRSDEAYENSKK
ncbi:hypothetical protein LY90DRAFT_375786, partial [Neocallimastix californiae]